MTPRSDPHTEAIRQFIERSHDDGRGYPGVESALAALAALESERDEALLRAERDALAESETLFVRAVAAEARVTQLEEPGADLIAWIDRQGLAVFSTIDHNFRAKIDRLRSALGVVADGGGGRDE